MPGEPHRKVMHHGFVDVLESSDLCTHQPSQLDVPGQPQPSRVGVHPPAGFVTAQMPLDSETHQFQRAVEHGGRKDKTATVHRDLNPLVPERPAAVAGLVFQVEPTALRAAGILVLEMQAMSMKAAAVRGQVIDAH